MNRKFSLQLKQKAINLRKQGNTFSEINKILDYKIPKSTFSGWFKNTELNSKARKILDGKISNFSALGRKAALKVKYAKRKSYFENIFNNGEGIVNLLNNKDDKKLALVILYLAEGSKNTNGSVVFGNSNPLIIKLFLDLLRSVYDIDESKFRCTLQCRADQDISSLEIFWSKLSGIPKSQFYKARIDIRTIGMVSKKLEYKGVCRLDYFSSNVYNELRAFGNLLLVNGDKKGAYSLTVK